MALQSALDQPITQAVAMLTTDLVYLQISHMSVATQVHVLYRVCLKFVTPTHAC